MPVHFYKINRENIRIEQDCMEQTVAKKPSLARNTIFYLVFSVLNALFPFLMSLYVARILQSDSIGTVSYALNIVTYFSIFAFVGIPTYGMREVAKCKDDKDALNKLFSELLIINTITTTISLGLYIGLIFLVPNFNGEHLVLYLFCAILIALNYFNVTWLYEGFEKFGLNAIINILTKLISFVLLILFVKSDEHQLIYAILSVVGLSGYYLVSFFFFPRYARFTVKGLSFAKHIKPILFLVVVNLAIEIYSLLDITMIGAIMTNSKSPVTYYKYASQIQKTLLMVVNALTMVIVPRLSKFYKEQKFDEYNALIYRTLTMIFIIAIPMVIGIMFTSDQLVVWIYGDEYIACSNILKILSANIIISPIGYLLGSRVCLTSGKEKYMPIAVGVGALVNIGLNALFIWLIGAEGAAIASICSEMCVLGVYLIFSHKYFKLTWRWKNILKILTSLVVMTSYLLVIYFFVPHPILKVALEIGGAIILYFGVLLLLREDMLFSSFKKVFHLKQKEEVKEDD